MVINCRKAIVVKCLKFYILFNFLFSSLYASETAIITSEGGKYQKTNAPNNILRQLGLYCDFPRGVLWGSQYCRHDERSKVGISKRYKRDLFKWEKSLRSLLRVLPKEDLFRKEIIDKALGVNIPTKKELKDIFNKHNLSAQFNKNIWKHFKNSRAKRKTSKIWHAHCEMVTENDADSLCPKIDINKLIKLTKDIPFYPNETEENKMCKQLLKQISDESDFKELAKMKKRLGENCVNWCANFTDEERSFHCEAPLEHSEEPERLHRCDGWWASKYKNKRNLSEADVVRACSVSTISNMNPLSSFEELIKNLMGAMARVSEQEIRSDGGTSFTARIVSGAKNPFDATWRSYPMLLRIEALGGFLESACEVSGGNIKAPKSCKKFSKGIENYQCSESQKKELNPQRKKDIIKKAKNLVTLFRQKEKLKKKYDKKVSSCIARKSKLSVAFAASNLFQPADPAKFLYDKKFCEDLNKELKDRISTLESLIVYLSKDEPVLFSYADSSKSIFEQDNLFHQRIKTLSKRSIRNFNASFKGFKKAAKKKIATSMGDICDPDKVSTKDLLQMKSLTDSVKKRFPVFKDIDKCLGKPDPTDVGGAFGVGTTLLCLAGSVGPQFFIVGGLCAGLFLGDSIVTAGEQKELLSFMRSSSLAGGRISSHEDIARVEQNLESAKFDVMMGVVLLPLDFIGGKQALKAITKGLKRVKSVPQRAFLMKKINERVTEISKISNPAKRKEQALIFLSELENSKSTFTRLLRDKSNPKYESYDEDWLKFVRGRCL